MDDRWNRIPDGIDPIVGYRAWYYTIGQRGAQLHPLTRRSAAAPGAGDWDGASWGWVTATCARDTASWHVAPEEDCTCGFYAMSTLPPVVSGCGFRTGEVEPGATSGVVLGRVELAGKIIEHDRGYRAERARIAELIPFRGTEQSVMILAARLGVPIAEPVDMPSMQDGFGGFPGQPQGGPPRLRDYVEEHRWMAATILVGLVVVAIQPTTITTVVLFALLFADKLDRRVAPRQAPTPSPNRSRPTPPHRLPGGSLPPAA
jgi:hypothetical protein